MSDDTPIGDGEHIREHTGIQENSGLSLTKAVEDVSHQSYIQTEALKEKQRTLTSLQAVLFDIQKKNEAADRELKCKARELLTLEAELEDAALQTRVLQDSWASIRKDSLELSAAISEQEEISSEMLEKFSAYRDKMESHRAALLLEVSRTEAHKEVEEKREQLRKLKWEKEELRKDLESPNGKTVRLQKRAAEVLKERISTKRAVISDQKEQLQKEAEVHTQITKDIEIQNRRHEAIVKRLHCQLSRARAARRQVCEDIFHMRRQLAGLRSQHDSTGSES